MKAHRIELAWQQGIIDKPLHEILCLQPAPVPQVIWLEPRPFLTAATDLEAPITFQGLQTVHNENKDWAQQILSDGIIAEEVCLYWVDRFCHLLKTADGNGCRWFYCRETGTDINYFSEPQPVKQVKTGSTEVEKVASSQPVIVRQETQRFGLNAYQDKSQHFKAVTYWENSALFAWRLFQ